jgi:hypothetical protein
MRESIQISIKYAALLATLVLSLYSITLPIIAILLVMKDNCRSTKRIGGCRFSCNSSQLIELLIFKLRVRLKALLLTLSKQGFS